MARKRLLKKSTQTKILRYWGYLLLPVLYWAWFVGGLGYGPIAVISTIAALFFLFQARMPCGAPNRDDTYCRNNGKGLLGGCNQIVAHKWYKAKMLIRRSTWGRFTRSAFLKFEGRAATFAAMATCLSTFVAVGALLVSTFAFLDPRVPK